MVLHRVREHCAQRVDRAWMIVRPRARLNARYCTKRLACMGLAELLDALSVVLNRRVASQSPQVTSPVIVRPSRSERVAGLVARSGPSTIACVEGCSLDPPGLSFTGRRLEPESADLAPVELALLVRVGIVDLDVPATVAFTNHSPSPLVLRASAQPPRRGIYALHRSAARAYRQPPSGAPFSG
jgi:hypothetical protein